MQDSSSALESYSDVTLIGAGIMSGTLGAFLTELAPEKSLAIFEKLSAVGLESSNEWNNAGTGHSALCELNYTEQKANGEVSVERAVKICEDFQLSLQLWSYLVETGRIQAPREFIHRIPHISFVQGEQNAQFLQKRYQSLAQSHLFEGMQFSRDHQQLAQWMPLMMQNRDSNETLAASYIQYGTDVNFGELTRKLFDYLVKQKAELNLNHTVKNIQRLANGEWKLTVVDQQGQKRVHRSKFVFIGGGGGALPLLQKSGITDGKNVGGFPVSGLFMVCNNPEVIAKHNAKVYGKAKLGAPPMSVPHLDTRFIEGKQSLLFGPFAGFTLKFLKQGSVLDLPTSVTPTNFCSVTKAGIKNLPLAHYLMKQAMLTKAQRMADLREFVPDAKDEDWDVVVAGQRVQVIKGGEMRFGTEVIRAEDGSLAALLGASPGASTSVKAMLDVLVSCFAAELPQWQAKLTQMLPSYGKALRNEPQLYAQIKQRVDQVLALAN
ncbi:malate:quinone oxidoreductase [Actinobacillus pleuropneumoniae]|uniref:Probable malate:quinone oxidoreductase n=1 Tax=Actinobacillus pleuropneumoniae serotype 5b (strain L20) TaxID=416269 RepID=MQO_ACTP2|nr:malate dehydrogenase (quinone) [Actinobacillus pleuropneumoniae]A3N262.1 RecName: Full=Probable malate:quinone oxidoreductase; AltName: Full=MQO; AltName: Full=Malate dehydrogenase [quinone] [Actinobacillus pleuropneumoniae serovar 5b str. L20]ABN74498.1 putative malate:quinone oxidoreductase [Actinobacillus pleuropneumoniae serovar 5b str. L20]MEE3683607.1 malate dehydrogenase (quinone) [Actinobacillus pleuropneumoniae]QSZ39466.1 malate:quinone oxidoreductase [Actinobacillus pleuropneumonia